MPEKEPILDKLPNNISMINELEDIFKQTKYWEDLGITIEDRAIFQKALEVLREYDSKNPEAVAKAIEELKKYHERNVELLENYKQMEKDDNTQGMDEYKGKMHQNSAWQKIFLGQYILSKTFFIKY